MNLLVRELRRTAHVQLSTIHVSRLCSSGSSPKDPIPQWARVLGVETQEDWAKTKSPQGKAFMAFCTAALMGLALFSSYAREEYGVSLSRWGGEKIIPPRMVNDGETLAEYQQRLKDTKEWREAHPAPKKREGESWREYTDRLNKTWGQGKPDQ
eukprot:TRINITY_DN64985_c0_g1_i1.p1 TRINITY_DN64985_c0_g1~~TRINITY_DN64985_c0_g1_i1.p1  ORF type:complete len:154 (-),score=15.00 TRINITY_DN64985_c0_g1_i1:305-766(-)